MDTNAQPQPSPHDQGALPSPDARADEAPRVGRFQLLRRLGQGGMGVVYAAYDEELDRRVAVKLIRGDHGTQVNARVRREAQAMAKLNHPNVASVYEVGVQDGALFIAMEYVKGQTLREWCKVQSRPWREVLAMLVQAGRGLAAAHAVDLVHRDFKPDNVLCGVDGRARVLDFGLARSSERETVKDDVIETRLPAPQYDALGTPLTATGSVMGTPAYMAPEQFLGEATDARTDQFAFCVTAWEALHGERPFVGESRAELARAVTSGKRRDAGKVGVPSWVNQALVHGLSTEPSARHPSMEALLSALERGESRVRTRRVIAAVAGVGMLLAGVEGTRRYARAREISACESTGASIEEVWNDGAREAVRAGILATGASFATATADKVTPWLDAYAQAWRDARTQACVATEIEGTWTPDVHERSAWCLDERKLALEAVVADLGEADVELVLRAVRIAAGLPQVETCLDVRLVTRLPAPPSQGRDGIRAVRAQLARAAALDSAHDVAESVTLLRAALADAQALGWPPLVAHAERWLGSWLAYAGQFAEAEQVLEDAYFHAQLAGASEVVFSASEDLAELVEHAGGRDADAKRWWRQAEVALVALGDDGQSLRTAEHLAMLANVHMSTGAYAEARALYERALAIREALLGAQHPTVGFALVSVGNAHAMTGANAEATAHYERAITIIEATLGLEHPSATTALNSLARIHYTTGDYAESKRLMARAIGIATKAFGADSAAVAEFGSNLADVQRATGAHAEAKVLYERALVIWQRKFGAEHPKLSYPLVGLADIALATAHPADAVGLAERALAIRTKTGAPAEELAEGRFLLARALGAAPSDRGGDRARAVSLAGEARDGYRAAGETSKQQLEVVEQWLREHPAPP